MNRVSASIVFANSRPDLSGRRGVIADCFLRDEREHVEWLVAELDISPAIQRQIDQMATDLVTRVRERAQSQGVLDAFMQQYDLSSEEGVLLMCLAEALLRIPDADTADKLIADKLGEADWQAHLGKSRSMFVNASTWSLMLTGRLVRISESTQRDFLATLKKLAAKTGEPVVRRAVRQAMRIMGHQFVLGRNIEEALKRIRSRDNRPYRFSFDMLGEAALTAADAERYYRTYIHAIEAVGQNDQGNDVFAAPSMSVKLSALHPRYEPSQHDRIMVELLPRLLTLAQTAKRHGIAMTVDAEEADRLQLSLDLFAATYLDASLRGWEGFGLVVQAYQKRAPAIIDWLADLAGAAGRRIPVRLVKGAYWDTEIKRCQELGLSGYPVFTRKASTDVSYLACAQRLLKAPQAFYPQFATHNAQTLAAVYQFAGDNRDFEYQRLYGMGEDLYAEVIDPNKLAIPCRVYAPVGSHEDLLPYLVRRLLENGANTSFVNRITDQEAPVAEIVSDPVAATRTFRFQGHQGIPLPRDLFAKERRNSRGVHLADERALAWLAATIAEHPAGEWYAQPLVPGAVLKDLAIHDVFDPTDLRQKIGSWGAADSATVERALSQAWLGHEKWDRTSVVERSACLERAADLLEQRSGLFMSLLIHEAGKTLADGVAEIREAVDFCRYYAALARQLMAQPETLPGPTGESNSLSLHGRGVFVAISPWNFPLAIFSGQVTAALVTGNAVLAKPAAQTNLIAYHATQLLHEAGIPKDALQFLPGGGSTVGAQLTSDERICGVVFTGSTVTAQGINRVLAERSGPLGVLLAETGGINCMIADSSALPEQLVKDVIASAFHSAGQRCSALRALLVQDDIADRVIEMLAGAIAELAVGDPALLASDVGPVIDANAQRDLNDYCVQLRRSARQIGCATLPSTTEHGCFVAPVAFEIDSIDALESEVFGPVLHVLRYRARDLDQVIESVNGLGYGLTLGIHSRIASTCDRIAARVRCGNRYVNRNMIGATVGVQPFGGEGLSGTGPKAGGPHYLHRFVTERTLTVNTAAVGGNTGLLSLSES